MANKRMFSIDVTETDDFLGLPLTAQALYFHLGMHGDDDGFVSNPRSIMRVSGCTESDLRVLVESGYILAFRTGVIVISDWRVNNNLRNDRYKPTIFQNERSMLSETANKRYVLIRGNQVDTVGIPLVSRVTPQPNVTKRNLAERSCSSDGNRMATDGIPTAATTAARNPRTDEDLAEIVQYFQAVIGPFPRSALEKLQHYREIFSSELICKAIDEAAENGVRRWRYVDGVLSSWKADDVRTLGDVEARREARRKPEPPQEKKMEVLT